MNKHIHEKIAAGEDLNSHELEALIRSLPSGGDHERLEDTRFEVIRSKFQVNGKSYSLRWLRQSDAPEGGERIVRHYGQPVEE